MFIFFCFVLNSCFNHDEGWTPCLSLYPLPSNDLSQIIILKDGDTIEVIKEFDYVIAYCNTYNITYNADDVTSVEIYKNNNSDHDSGYYLYFSFKGYGTGNYTSNVILTFKQFDKNYLSDKSQIEITKYEDVWDLIEGNFADDFIYENDTIFVSCRFSALRWCAGGNRNGSQIK